MSAHDEPTPIPPDIGEELDRLEDESRVEAMRDGLLDALYGLNVALNGVDNEGREDVRNLGDRRQAVRYALESADAYFVGKGDVPASRRLDRQARRERIGKRLRAS